MSSEKPTTNRLKELRTRGKEKGGLWLTLEEVGDLLEVDYTTVSRHEAGRGLTADMIEKYAKLYKVETFEIFLNPLQLTGS
jgi:hypothetical protein